LDATGETVEGGAAAPAPAPLVTAIVTSYNYGHYLGEAVDSALNQTYQNLEVVVVDDGSTDDSRDILREYGERIRTIFKPNGGQASAFNTGVAAARGDIICFLDSDDAWLPAKVATVVEKYREAPWGLVCHALETRCAPGCQVRDLPRVDLWSGEIFERLREQAFAPWPFSAPTGMAIPARLARRIFPLPEPEWRLWADTPLAFSAAYLGPVGAIDARLGIYRVHDRNGHAEAVDCPERLRVWGLAHSQRKIAYLRRFVAAQGGSLDFDLRDHYPFFRKWCLIASAFPLGHLGRLWRTSVAFRRREGARLWPILRSLLRDSLVVGAVTLGLVSQYRPLRRLYRAAARDRG
jgi:glycosyltransferase involved in cell wall biosynthesis